MKASSSKDTGLKSLRLEILILKWHSVDHLFHEVPQWNPPRTMLLSFPGEKALSVSMKLKKIYKHSELAVPEPEHSLGKNIEQPNTIVLQV